MSPAAVLYGDDGGSVPSGLLDELMRWAAHAAVFSAVRRLFYSLTPAEGLVALVVIVGAYWYSRRRRGRTWARGSFSAPTRFRRRR